MAKCETCGIDLSKFANPKTGAHRCLKPPSAKREPYQPKATTAQPGRLAPRPADTQPAPSRQPTLADILAAIDKLRLQFEALRSTLTKPRTDA